MAYNDSVTYVSGDVGRFPCTDEWKFGVPSLIDTSKEKDDVLVRVRIPITPIDTDQVHGTFAEECVRNPPDEYWKKGDTLVLNQQYRFKHWAKGGWQVSDGR